MTRAQRIEAQQEILDSDTFNFLMELRMVSMGSYITLISKAEMGHKFPHEWIKECQR